MNTAHFPAAAASSIPRRLRTRSASTPHPLLWVSGALALIIIVFTVALIAGRVLGGDAIALEIEPAVIDPFHQQKVEAKQEELPAQF